MLGSVPLERVEDVEHIQGVLPGVDPGKYLHCCFRLLLSNPDVMAEVGGSHHQSRGPTVSYEVHAIAGSPEVAAGWVGSIAEACRSLRVVLRGGEEEEEGEEEVRKTKEGARRRVMLADKVREMGKKKAEEEEEGGGKKSTTLSEGGASEEEIAGRLVEIALEDETNELKIVRDRLKRLRWKAAAALASSSAEREMSRRQCELAMASLAIEREAADKATTERDLLLEHCAALEVRIQSGAGPPPLQGAFYNKNELQTDPTITTTSKEKGGRDDNGLIDLVFDLRQESAQLTKRIASLEMSLAKANHEAEMARDSIQAAAESAESENQLRVAAMALEKSVPVYMDAVNDDTLMGEIMLRGNTLVGKIVNQLAMEFEIEGAMDTTLGGRKLRQLRYDSPLGFEMPYELTDVSVGKEVVIRRTS